MIFHVSRIGLSLVTNAPLNGEVNAKTDAALGIARAFSFISSDKDTRRAFDWLIKVSNAIGPFHLNSYNANFFAFSCVRACVCACLLVFLKSWVCSFTLHLKLKSILF